MSFNRDSYKSMPSTPHRSNFNDAANMPIFDDPVSSNFSSQDFIPGSPALKALQGYGSMRQNVGRLETEFSSNYPFSDDRSSDVSMTPNHASTENVFKSLNLNSVEEEDEFLYGDSSSLPEDHTPAKETTEEISDKPNSGWSDEDDFYIEAVIPKKDVKPIEKKNPYVWKKKIESNVMPKKIIEEKPIFSTSRNVYREESIEKDLPPSSPERSVSAVKGIAKLQVSIKNSNERREFDSSTEISKTGPKSKYHAAAELLKKQAIEKSMLKKKMELSSNLASAEIMNIRNDAHESVSNTELSAKRTVILPKNSKKISLESSAVSNDHKALNTGDLRRPAKHFFQSEFHETAAYRPNAGKTRSATPTEYDYQLKQYEKLKGISSFSHNSPSYESPRPHRHHSRSPSFESSRSPRRHSRSPSNEYRSRHRSRSPSFGHHSRGRSPFSLRKRSPEYKYGQKYHSSHHRSPHEYSRRHSSRSPIRKSNERSPVHYRHRSRSRSPGYYSSKSKYSYPDREKLKDETEISVKKDGAHRLKLDDSLSTFKHSKSPSENKLVPKKIFPKIAEKNKEDLRNKLKAISEKSQNIHPEKPPVKISEVSNFRPENIPENLKNEISESPDETDDVYQNLNDEEKKILSMYNQLENMNFIQELIKTQQGFSNLENSNQTPIDFPNNSTDTSSNNAVDIPNMFNVPNETGPSMSYQQMFPFNPVIPSMPLQFPAAIPVQEFPSPVVPPVETAYQFPTIIPQPANIYPPTVPNVAVSEMKQQKKSPTFRTPPNLISIPVSDNVISPPNNKKAQQEVTDATKPEKWQLNRLSPKTPSENVTKKEQVKPVKEKIIPQKKSDPTMSSGKSSSTQNKKVLTAAEVRSKENRAAMLESYKKLKAKRYKVQSKVNKAVSDIIEMRNMIDSTWSKKSNISEKLIHGKCKSVLATSTDNMNKFIKEAKSCDEELSKFKEKMPADLQSEVAKLRTEDFLKEQEKPNTENYVLYDPGKHSCYACNKQFDTVSTMLEHIQSSEHTEKSDSSEKDWVDEFRRKPYDDSRRIKNPNLQPIKGIEFIKPSTGFFCTLCKEYCLDQKDAEIHLWSPEHYVTYEFYKIDHPLYESKCLVKRLIKYAVGNNESRKRQAVENEEKSAKKKKENAESDKKVKEMLKNQDRNETKLKELEELDSDVIDSKNPKNPGIKLNLSGDKEREKSATDGKTKDSKAAQRVVFIGKAPNYKAQARSKPWYKREAFSDKQDASSSPSSSEKFLEQLKISSKNFIQEKISSKQDSPNDKYSPSRPTQRDYSPTNNNSSESITDSSKGEKSDLKEAKASEENNRKPNTSKDKLNVKADDKSNRGNTFIGPVVYKNASEVLAKKTSVVQEYKNSNDTKLEKEKIPKSDGEKNPVVKSHKNKDPVVNQALTNILYGTDSSSRPQVSLSEIKLPAKSTPHSKSKGSNESNNNSVPMDISPPRENNPNIIEFPQQPKTEEEKDFYMLGLNKEDMTPLAVPVPPPLHNYYPGQSNVTSSMPPIHVLSSIPPPGYNRNATNVPYNTNVPPPGYNANPMSIATSPVSTAPGYNTNVLPPGYNANPISISTSPVSTVPSMQVSPNFIPTNIPPPNYQINVSVPPPGSHYPPPPSTMSPGVIQEISTINRFAIPKLKKKSPGNTNLITIVSRTKPHTPPAVVPNPTKKPFLKTPPTEKNILKTSQQSLQSKIDNSKNKMTPDVGQLTDLKRIKSRVDQVENSPVQKNESKPSQQNQISRTGNSLSRNTANKTETKSKDVSMVASSSAVTEKNENLKNADDESQLKIDVDNKKEVEKSDDSDIQFITEVKGQPKVNAKNAATVKKILTSKKTEDINNSKNNAELTAKDNENKISGNIGNSKNVLQLGTNVDKNVTISENTENSKGKSDLKGGNLCVVTSDHSEKLQNLKTEKNSHETNKKSCLLKNSEDKGVASTEQSVHKSMALTNENISISETGPTNVSDDNSESVFNYQAFEKLAALTQNSEENLMGNTAGEESKNSDTNLSTPPVLELENKNYPKGRKTDFSKISFNNDSNQSTPPVLELEIMKDDYKSPNYHEVDLTLESLKANAMKKMFNSEGQIGGPKMDVGTNENSRSETFPNNKGDQFKYTELKSPNSIQKDAKEVTSDKTDIELESQGNVIETGVTEENMQSKTDDAYDSDTETDEYDDEDLT